MNREVDSSWSALTRRLAPIAAAAALCAATLLVYLPTPGDYWIRYDNEVLLRAPRIQALTLEGSERVDALVEMFTTPHGDLYQPLMTFSIAVDAKLFGDDRSGYHAHALALHIASVIGLFALAFRLTGSLWASFLAMLVIAVHPILVETTSWVIHRTILTAMLSIVVGSHAYLCYARDPKRWPWLVLATLAFSVSLLGKSVPSVVLIPFAIDLWIARRPSARLFAEKLPLLATCAIVVGLNLFVSNAAVDPEVIPRPVGDVISEAPVAFALTVANLVWPAHLTIFYAAGQSASLLGARVIAVALAAAAIGIGGIALWRRGVRGPLLTAVLWIAFLGPYLLVGSYRDTSTADRYAYMGTLLLGLGLAAALAYLIAPDARAGSSSRNRRVPYWLAGLATLAIALPLGLQAHTLARRWSDESLLWNAVLERSPHPTAYGALSNVHRERGDFEAALEAAEQALALLPGEPFASQRGIYHLVAVQSAIAAYDRAFKQGTANDVQLASFLERAVNVSRDGIARWPHRPEFHFELGRALLAAKDYAGAAEAFARTVERQSDNVRAMARLGLARNGLGDVTGAIATLEEALRVQPRYALALEILANLYWQQERYADSAATFLALADARPAAQGARRGFFASIAALETEGATRERNALMERYAQRFPDADEDEAARQPDRESPSGSM